MGFITSPIFTRLLPEDEYGAVSVFLSYEQLILIFATWEIYLGAYQKGIFKYKDDIPLFTTSTNALVNLLTVGCFALILVFSRAVMDFTEMSPLMLVLLFFYALTYPSYNCWLARKRKVYSYKPAVTLTVIYSLVNVIVPMAALLLIGRTAEVRISAMLISSIVICLFFYLPSINYRTLLRNWQQVKQQWKFCLAFEGPLVLHSLSFLVLNQSDRVMVSRMIGNAQAAYYSVAVNISSVVSLLQSSINQSLQPWRYQMLQDKNYSAIRKVTNQILLAYGALILVFIMVVPEVFYLVFPANYAEAIWSIPPVTTASFFMFLYSMFVNVEEYYEKTKYVVLVSVSCGIINIILNYFCIGRFGYIACAYTTLFSYALFAVGHYIFMKRSVEESGVTAEIFDRKAITLISVAITAASFAVTILYKAPLIRYGIVAALAAVCVYKRDTLLEIFQRLKQR